VLSLINLAKESNEAIRENMDRKATRKIIAVIQVIIRCNSKSAMKLQTTPITMKSSLLPNSRRNPDEGVMLV
jgi:hypothetical protein